MSDTEFSRSATIRRMILENPEITLEQLQAEYEGPGVVPNKIHVLYQEKSNVRRKLGLEEIDVPQHNGRFNITGFLRDFCVGMSYQEARKFCAYFAVEVSSTLYSQALGGKNKTIQPETETEFEPDANQDSGPRTRKKGKRGRKRADAASTPTSQPVSYESIENSLDDLIQQASGLKDDNLVETLKNARRQVGASILDS